MLKLLITAIMLIIFSIPMTALANSPDPNVEVDTYWVLAEQDIEAQKEEVLLLLREAHENNQDLTALQTQLTALDQRITALTLRPHALVEIVRAWGRHEISKTRALFELSKIYDGDQHLGAQALHRFYLMPPNSPFFADIVEEPEFGRQGPPVPVEDNPHTSPPHHEHPKPHHGHHHVPHA